MAAAASPPICDFVFGGARSGKTALALERAEASGLALVMLATAEALDAEMSERIAAHRAERGPRWTTIEEARDLAGTLDRVAAAGRIVVVDCLTLWLSNLMAAEANIDVEIDRLCEVLAGLAGPVILVSNEVGLGIVSRRWPPASPSSPPVWRW